MNFWTIILLGLLVAMTAKAGDEKFITERTLGVVYLSDVETLMDLMKYEDVEAVGDLLQEARCKIISKGTAVFITDQQGFFTNVRIKGTTDTFWVLKTFVGDSQPGASSPDLQVGESTPIPESTPRPQATPTPMSAMSVEQLNQFQAEWKQVADEDKRQRELYQKQQAQREARVEALREANGDFSHAPGMTPEQKEAAHIRWVEEDAKKSVIGATPSKQ